MRGGDALAQAPAAEERRVAGAQAFELLDRLRPGQQEFPIGGDEHRVQIVRGAVGGEDVERVPFVDPPGGGVVEAPGEGLDDDGITIDIGDMGRVRGVLGEDFRLFAGEFQHRPASGHQQRVLGLGEGRTPAAG